MTNCNLKYCFRRAVINGQLAANGRNLDAAHNTVAGQIELLFIEQPLFVGHFEAGHVADEGFIVGIGAFPGGGIDGGIHLGYLLGIGNDGPGLVHGVPPVADGGVQQQGQSGKEHQDQDEIGEMAFH